MTKTLQEMIAVMQAAAEGKKIEGRPLRSSATWADYPSPLWDWESFDYRVKPEPREFYICIYPSNQRVAFAHHTLTDAEAARISATSPSAVAIIKVREVIE